MRRRSSRSLAIIYVSTIAPDEPRRLRKMRVMAVVWPWTALFGGVLWSVIYYRRGRAPVDQDGGTADPSLAISVLTGANHCGAAVAFPALAVWFGYGGLFAERTFATSCPANRWLIIAGVMECM